MIPEFLRDDAMALGFYIAFHMPLYGNGVDNGWNSTWSSPDGISRHRGFMIHDDGAGGGERGHNGKNKPGDLYFSDAFVTLAGYGADQEGGGAGFRKGKFGVGGGGTTFILLQSCGGGGGWYGGGSSYGGAGGGGGSGYVLNYDSYLPTLHGSDGSTKTYGPTDVQFFAIGGTTQLQPDVQKGNGWATIGGQIFNYTGQVQTYICAQDGFYEIECFGAQGGSAGPDDKHSGGKGGYATARFLLRAGTILYIYVGQEGRRSALQAWNGGGIGNGYCYGGGGSTDVRWAEPLDLDDWFSTIDTRFIVAGGGGGQGQYIPFGVDLPPTLNQPIDSDHSSPSTPPSPPEQGPINTGKQQYLVNDSTLCDVVITYTGTQDVDPEDYVKVTVYVDGVNRGTILHKPLAGGGTDKFTFDFSEWLPPDTPPNWSTIEVVIDTNLDIDIPPHGLVINTRTKKRPNDPVPSSKPILLDLKGRFKLNARLDMLLVDDLDLSSLSARMKLGAYINMLITASPVPPVLDFLQAKLNLKGSIDIGIVEVPVPPDLTLLQGKLTVKGSINIGIVDVPVPPDLTALKGNLKLTSGVDINIKEVPVPPDLTSLKGNLTVSSKIDITIT